jgi:hypothetical protein
VGMGLIDDSLILESKIVPIICPLFM